MDGQMSASPWWSEADQAELDCLLWELVDGIFEHRERCRRCVAHRAHEKGSLPCPHVVKAIGIVVDWQHRRELVSRAAYLRAAEHDRIEALA